MSEEAKGARADEKPSQVHYVSIVSYEDGCQKTSWKNFHENGHQHICVCGQYDPHPDRPLVAAVVLAADALVDEFDRRFDLHHLITEESRLREAVMAYRAAREAEGYREARGKE
jgi:hypothetical protein